MTCAVRTVHAMSVSLCTSISLRVLRKKNLLFHFSLFSSSDHNPLLDVVCPLLLVSESPSESGLPSPPPTKPTQLSDRRAKPFFLDATIRHFFSTPSPSPTSFSSPFSCLKGGTFCSCCFIPPTPPVILHKILLFSASLAEYFK